MRGWGLQRPLNPKPTFSPNAPCDGGWPWGLPTGYGMAWHGLRSWDAGPAEAAFHVGLHLCWIYWPGSLLCGCQRVCVHLGAVSRRQEKSCPLRRWNCNWGWARARPAHPKRTSFTGVSLKRNKPETVSGPGWPACPAASFLVPRSLVTVSQCLLLAFC